VVEPGETPVHAAARRRKLGEVQRIYRERNPLWTLPGLVIAVVATITVVAGGGPDTRWRWPVLLLGPVLGAAVVVGYMFLGRVEGVQRRRLIGVSPLGVLVYAGRQPSIALPWARIVSFTRRPGRSGPRYVLVSRTSSGTECIEFRDIHDGRSLVTAVREERPVPAPVRRRVLVSTAVTGVVTLLGWLSYHAAFAVGETDRLPAELAGFVEVCQEPGTAFTRAAPFAAATPRPVVVFDGNSRRGQIGQGPWGPTSATEVQVVVCAVRTGAGEVVTSCGYGGFSGPVARHVVRMDRGEYRVTVYQARTRKVVRVFTLTGADEECPGSIRTDVDFIYTKPTNGQYHKAMSDLVGPPG
jgi:hypothetical protein